MSHAIDLLVYAALAGVVLLVLAVTGVVLLLVGAHQSDRIVGRYGRPLDWDTTGYDGWLFGILHRDDVDGWSLVEEHAPRRRLPLRGPHLDSACRRGARALVVGRSAYEEANAAEAGAYRGGGARDEGLLRPIARGGAARARDLDRAPLSVGAPPHRRRLRRHGGLDRAARGRARQGSDRLTGNRARR